ncbi:hypothetical protein [Anatilimnocola floriformis]|uniref:hypothetical protein n=1 Tax=Anatilimnocola floriformis TaxID=2948575 RepID=UPI0020C2A103|nr:hypothetical protein [Anatilimnocola floriformis]
MRLSANGYTASGSLVLFWPEQLPADFNERWHDEPHELCEQLQAEKRLLLISLDPCGAELYPWDLDGDYTLGLFIDESIPAELEQLCTLEWKCEDLNVAGPTWFGGIEYLSRDIESLAILSRRKANEVVIPAGNYSAELFSAQYADHIYEDWLCEQAGESAQRWWWLQTWFASLGIVALLIFVGCLFFGTRQSVWISSSVAAALVSTGWLMTRTAGYQAIQRARQSYAGEHPHFVLRLKVLQH